MVDYGFVGATPRGCPFPVIGQAQGPAPTDSYICPASCRAVVHLIRDGVTSGNAYAGIVFTYLRITIREAMCSFKLPCRGASSVKGKAYLIQRGVICRAQPLKYKLNESGDVGECQFAFKE